MPGHDLELQEQMIEPYPAWAGATLARAVIAVTGRLPASWQGLRLTIRLRRNDTMRRLRPRLRRLRHARHPYRAGVQVCR
jgi:hypothetical protein